MTDYVAKMWFQEVSLQLQGQEIYAIMLKKSGAADRLAQLRDAIADDDKLAADRQRKNDETHRQNFSLLAAGAAAAFITLQVIMLLWPNDPGELSWPSGSFCPACFSESAGAIFDFMKPVLGAIGAGWLVAALTLRHNSATTDQPIGLLGAVRDVPKRVAGWVQGKARL